MKSTDLTFYEAASLSVGVQITPPSFSGEANGKLGDTSNNRKYGLSITKTWRTVCEDCSR